MFAGWKTVNFLMVWLLCNFIFHSIGEYVVLLLHFVESFNCNTLSRQKSETTFNVHGKKVMNVC